MRRELGEVVQDLLVLQLWQGTTLVDRPLAEPTGRATGRTGQAEDEQTRTTCIDVPDGDERTVCTGSIGGKTGLDFENRGDFNAAIAFPLSPLSSHACCGRHAQNAAAGTETALTRRGQRWSGRRSPGWILPSGDAIEAGEVVHAEVASRVVD